MQNQDPLKPMDDAAYLGQLAQFTSLQQVNTLSTQITQMRSDQQKLAAATYLGRTVTMDDGKKGTVSGAAFASRLPNGDTLISDGGNNRIVEVNSNDDVVWQYVTNTGPGSNPNPLPSRGIRLKNGDTLISDQYNNRVVQVNPAGKIVFQQGKINVGGDGFNQLNGPYDAKQIGDFTGLTPPLFP